MRNVIVFTILFFTLIVPNIFAQTSFSLTGRLTNSLGNPLSTTITAYNPGTTTVLGSTSTNSNGDYALTLTDGAYDINYSFNNFFKPEFFVKLYSVNVNININNLLSVSEQKNKVILLINSTDLIDLDFYSEKEPIGIKIGNNYLSRVQSSSEIAEGKWFYNSASKSIRMKYRSSNTTFRIGIHAVIETIPQYGARNGVNVGLSYAGGQNFYNYISNNGNRGYFSAIAIELTTPPLAPESWRGQVGFMKGLLDAADADQNGEATHIFINWAPILGIQDPTFQNAILDFYNSIGSGRPSLKGLGLRGEFMGGRPQTVDEYNNIWKPAWWYLHDLSASYGYVWGSQELSGVLKNIPGALQEVNDWDQYLRTYQHVWAPDDPTNLQQNYVIFNSIKDETRTVVGTSILGMWDDVWNTPDYPPYYMSRAKFEKIFEGFYDAYNWEVSQYDKNVHAKYLFVETMPSTFGDANILDTSVYSECPYVDWVYELCIQYNCRLSTTPPSGQTWLGYNSDPSLGTVTDQPINPNPDPVIYPPYPSTVSVSPIPLPPFSTSPGKNIRIVGRMLELQGRSSAAGKTVEIWWSPARYSDISQHVKVADALVGSGMSSAWYDIIIQAQPYMVQQMTGDPTLVGYFYAKYPGDSNFLESVSFQEPILVRNKTYPITILCNPDEGSTTDHNPLNPRMHFEATRISWRYGDKDQNLPLVSSLEELDADEEYVFSVPSVWDYPSPIGRKYMSYWKVDSYDETNTNLISTENIYERQIYLTMDSPKVLTAIYTDPQTGTANVSVQTTPISGDVYFDGVYRGVAPITFNVDISLPGDHVISFGDYAGYTKPGNQGIYLVAGETQTVIGNYTKLPTANILFQDDFENGNLNLWDSKYGNPVASTDKAKNGTYSMRVSTSTGTNQWQGAKKQITSGGTISALFWFYPNSTISVGQIIPLITWEKTGWGTVTKASIENVSGEMKFKLEYYNGQTSQTVYSNPINLSKTWHSLEVVHTPVVNNKIQVWYDNSLVSEGRMLGNGQVANQFSLGLLGVNSQAVFYFDDVKVGDGFIGT